MPDEPVPSPRVLREQLAERLRKLRESVGLHQGEVAARAGWSVSKVQRVETAVVSISARDTETLLGIYEVTNADVTRLMTTMAKAARRRDSFTSFKRYFSAEYQELLSYEESATSVRSLNCFGLPGLVQTEEYARALLSVKHSDDRLEGLVEARRARQQILDQSAGPAFEFIVDEALLHREIGGRTALLLQLEHLRLAAARPNVTLRVLPFGAGAHLGHWEQFMIIEVPLTSPTGFSTETIVYREIGESEQLVRDSSRIADYENGYTKAANQALGAQDSLSLVDRLIRRADTLDATAQALTR